MSGVGDNLRFEIQYLKTGDLLKYERPVKSHSAKHVDYLASLITEFGFVRPILASADRVIIAGEGRLEAAKKIGMKAVPVIVLDHLTTAQVKALRIADNKASEGSTWDMSAVMAEIRDLIDMDFDVALTGFDIDAMMPELEGNEGNGDPDEVAPDVSDPVSKIGDVWILGNHRLAVGDATNPDVVASVLNGREPTMIVTDPPYGVEYDQSRREAAQQSGKVDGSKVKNKHKTTVLNDDKADWRDVWSIIPAPVAYVWFASLKAHDVISGFLACDFEFKSLIIWAKPHFAIGRAAYHWQHEPCAYFVKAGAQQDWTGDRKQSTVWDIKGMNVMGGSREGHDEKVGHGTQKPVECMARPIRNHGKAGDLIVDPFVGSGSTIIACEIEGRRCAAIGLDPKHADMTIQRWQKFTGEAATLESDGQTYAEVCAKA